MSAGDGRSWGPDTGGVGRTQGVIRLLEFCSAGSSTGKRI